MLLKESLLLDWELCSKCRSLLSMYHYEMKQTPKGSFVHTQSLHAKECAIVASARCYESEMQLRIRQKASNFVFQSQNFGTGAKLSERISWASHNLGSGPLYSFKSCGRGGAATQPTRNQGCVHVWRYRVETTSAIWHIWYVHPCNLLCSNCHWQWNLDDFQGSQGLIWVFTMESGGDLLHWGVESFHFKLDFQVENQLRVVYISRKALVPICQCPSQQMCQLKFFCTAGGGVNLDILSKLDIVQVVQVENFLWVGG